MGRPEKQRKVVSPPSFSMFKPAGIRSQYLEGITLTLDEYEAFRLADYDGLDHVEGAERMNISRPTFTRLIARARRKVAALIVDGNALVIEGGAVHFSENLIRCLDCETHFPSPLSRRRHVCPECGSSRIEDIAAKFGHGRCCRGNRGRNEM
ncbi:MAG: DUF134 domain-containing protein [Kiritimatiellaeota bacterium]|nr:DUF134 domain-containing protein [Kiritimatiellota bacterium]